MTWKRIAAIRWGLLVQLAVARIMSVHSDDRTSPCGACDRARVFSMR